MKTAREDTCSDSLAAQGGSEGAARSRLREILALMENLLPCRRLIDGLYNSYI